MSGRSILGAIGPQIIPGVVGGLVGLAGAILTMTILQPFVSQPFLTAAGDMSAPLVSRLLYGGITEEVIARWGVMTLVVWVMYRGLRHGTGPVPRSHYLVAIAIAAILFGIGHLPTAHRLTGTLTTPIIAYIVFGSAAFGVASGFLYWRYGLEAAMIGHMTAHVIMVAMS